ncbi:MAG: DoxX family protein [Ottowia sp.]|nr:DoxX family protein [Ottowia sp.]
MHGTVSDDIGKLVLRLCLGGLLVLHGIAKLRTGVAWLEGSLASHGLPSVIAYGVYAGEVLGPVLIIIGLWTRIGAALVLVNMIAAVALMHTADFFVLGGGGGWALELQAFYFLTALALLFLGAGRFSVGGSRGHWN